ncbi:transposase [uncultured Jannaschia sp.]|uniref:transposase n=1 Tax=uncultured Jannaschia sp. TaxID=293347 RepID=UPI00262ACA09|nr:transposase [uncultured Jannaschia sp.]
MPTRQLLEDLSTHKVPAAADAPGRAGCWFLFLPAYSPDLNPIEMAFAKLKAHLRRIGARTFDDLIIALGAICGLFDADKCQNHLRHAGYAPT